jgi:hypothetical protein
MEDLQSESDSTSPGLCHDHEPESPTDKSQVPVFILVTPA